MTEYGLYQGAWVCTGGNPACLPLLLIIAQHYNKIEKRTLFIVFRTQRERKITRW